MRTWAICNQKGGVGKTTTAVCLASLLAQRGQRVLLVDLDPHASASVYLLGRDGETVRDGVMTLFTAALERPERAIDAESVLGATEATSQERLSMLRATPALAALERRSAGREGFGRVLSRRLAQLEARFDHVIIDCPPTLGLLMINALAAADLVLVPVQTEHLALEGLRRMIATLDMVERSQRRRIERVVVPTLFDRRTRASLLALEQLRMDHAAVLWPEPIPVDTRLRDAARDGVPAPIASPEGRAVTAYRRLLEALLAGSLTVPLDVSAGASIDPAGVASDEAAGVTSSNATVERARGASIDPAHVAPAETMRDAPVDVAAQAMAAAS